MADSTKIESETVARWIVNGRKKVERENKRNKNAAKMV